MMMNTDNQRQFTGRDDNGRFTAGNPGRPLGAKGKTSKEALERVKLMKDGAIEKLWEAVNAGERWAIELVLSKVLPSGRTLELEGVAPHDLENALQAGEISFDEAKTLSATLKSIKEIQELDEIADRLQKLEQAVDEK